MTKKDADRMSKHQKDFCKKLADDIKELVKRRQMNVFQFGKAMAALMAVPAITLDSITAGCKSDPFFCAEHMPWVFDDYMNRVCQAKGNCP